MSAATASSIKPICFGCFRSEKESGETLKKCEECEVALYCSKECQEDDWAIHARACKKIKIFSLEKIAQAIASCPNIGYHASSNSSCFVLKHTGRGEEIYKTIQLINYKKFSMRLLLKGLLSSPIMAIHMHCVMNRIIQREHRNAKDVYIVSIEDDSLFPERMNKVWQIYLFKPTYSSDEKKS
jgi:hypothetical protein